MAARLPLSVTLSVALHAGGAAFWLGLNQMTQESRLRIISNVELLVPEIRPVAAPALRRAPTPPSTWNFLKMALPAVPKRVAPLELRAPQTQKRVIMDVPRRLEDKGRIRKEASLDQALDLSRKRAASLAQWDAGRAEERRARASLAELPKLEEVGGRKASRAALEMAALAEERGGRLKPQDIAAAAPLENRRAAPQPAQLPPEEAGPQPRRGMLSKMADLLTSEASPIQDRGLLEAPPKRQEVLKAEPAARKEAAALAVHKKKAVEIEGPLSDRKVVHYELPEFPAWAAAQGVVEAEVRIRFAVSPQGDVLPQTRIEKTSGYRALDKLAMDALQRWRFDALPGATASQWGVITFRFLLE